MMANELFQLTSPLLGGLFYQTVIAIELFHFMFILYGDIGMLCVSCYFFFFFETGRIIYPWLAWNLLCRLGFHSDPSAS